MRIKNHCILGIAAAILLVIGQPAYGAEISWTDWTSAETGNPGWALGTIILSDTKTVSIAYKGEVSFAQTSGGTNYWIPSEPYVSAAVKKPPSDPDIIALQGGDSTINTISFSEPVSNPVMAIVSLGQGGIPVRYKFSIPFKVLSYGKGYWGSGQFTGNTGNSLEGREGHGVIQFLGSVSSLSWTVETAEYWHGLTIGIPFDTQKQQQKQYGRIARNVLLILAGIAVAAVAARYAFLKWKPLPIPKPAPPADPTNLLQPTIQVQPKKDSGAQSLQVHGTFMTDVEIRFKPTADSGAQRLNFQSATLADEGDNHG